MANRKKATIALLTDLVHDLTDELKMALDYIDEQEQTIEELADVLGSVMR